MSKHLNQLRVINLGRVSYEKGQQNLCEVHSKVLGGNGGAVLVFQEFDPVVTCGKNMSAESLNHISSNLYRRGICARVFPSDRGGQVTAHMPGQLVIYPVLPLSQKGIGVRKFVHLLEQTVINLLNRYGITSSRDSEYPGVWIDKAKICALGVRIKQRVSMHGLALNVNPDLRLFDSIDPCGIVGRSVCRASNFSSTLPAMRIVCRDFVSEFCQNFEYSVLETIE